MTRKKAYTQFLLTIQPDYLSLPRNSKKQLKRAFRFAYDRKRKKILLFNPDLLKSPMTIFIRNIFCEKEIPQKNATECIFIRDEEVT